MSGAIAVMIAGGGVSYNGTITQAQQTDGSTFNILGLGPAGSSASPSVLSDGNSLSAWYDETVSGQSVFAVNISFNPGASYFAQVTAGATTKTSASRSNYSYSGGIATWTWTSTFGFTSSGTKACSVI